eukprot:NODE_4241_length_801_cov_53.603858_g4218_i0.p1 GENE.NODE_4241_length_801_cov_53.603858_g4218_i0~~NODE_4241_length_801_cov_53.603858_g4218_i0.p1  ORF type:complete len:195 (-),score=61.05 NODE_4241_length_801_cov_53.603858_g4218_i0:115-699(-)
MKRRGGTGGRARIGDVLLCAVCCVVMALLTAVSLRHHDALKQKRDAVDRAVQEHKERLRTKQVLMDQLDLFQMQFMANITKNVKRATEMLHEKGAVDPRDEANVIQQLKKLHHVRPQLAEPQQEIVDKAKAALKKAKELEPATAQMEEKYEDQQKRFAELRRQWPHWFDSDGSPLHVFEFKGHADYSDHPIKGK